jgi:hypothetical protein
MRVTESSGSLALRHQIPLRVSHCIHVSVMHRHDRFQVIARRFSGFFHSVSLPASSNPGGFISPVHLGVHNTEQLVLANV